MTTKTPNGRTKWVREKMGLIQSQFGTPMGVSQATVNRWESGETPIELSQALLMESAHGIRKEWILTGERPVWVEHGVATPSVAHRFVMRPMLGGSFLEEGGNPSLGPMDAMYPLPVDFAERVLGDSGGGTIGDLFYWRVEGASMEPTIRRGELILLNCSEPATDTISAGGIYLISRHINESTARLRRLWWDKHAELVRASSDNKAYPSFTLPGRPEELQPLIWGRACWFGRYLLDEAIVPGDW